MANENISYIGQVMGETENKESKIISVDGDGSLITVARKADVVFHDDATEAGSGAIFNVGNYKDLTVEIYGTSTSRTVAFYGIAASGVKRPISGINLNGYDMETSTTGNDELWTFSITGLKSVVMELTDVSGGTVNVKGEVVS